MQYTRLGRTGLQVSRLCLGTMNFGPETTEPDSFAIMDRALELGINFWDTADVYGWKMGERITERIIGNFFAQGGGRREKVVLATKVYNKVADWPNGERLSKLRIKKGCEDSLKAMRTDYIDLYQMHHIDRNAPWEELFEAFEQLVAEGKVLYIGSSNFAGWHIAEAQGVAKSRNFLGLVSEQSKYHLLCRYPELEVLPACERFGLGVIPWSPLASGVLGGALRKAAEGRRAQEGVQREIEKHRPALERWEALCQELGENPADVALAWLLHQKAVTAPIIGPRTLEQLNGSLRAPELTLGAETLDRIDEIFPAVGLFGPKSKPAPEAYAW
ncbi:MAG: aldo/keto reductase [Capsulimonadales bacterium]|nr:aldo/keto reductase [Capsulimonadales bacterium]